MRAAWRRSRPTLAAAEVDAFILIAPVAPLRAAPRRASTSSRAATATAGGRCPRARRADSRALDPLVQVRTAAVGHLRRASLRGRRCRRLPRLGLVHALAPRRRAVLAAPDAVVDHFLHTIIPTEAFVHTVLGQLARCGSRTTTAATPSSTRRRRRSPRPRARRRRRGARVGRRLRAQVRRHARCSTRSTAGARLTSAPPMAPPASILFPTRDRRDYLAVALASVAPQAARARRRDRGRRGRRRRTPRPRALAARHGARYVALGRPRGHQRRAQRGGRGLHRRARRASSTTTSRSGRAGSTRCSAAPRDRTTRSAARSARGSRARGCAPAGASRCRSPRSTSARRTATPSSCGARTWRCGAARSSAIGPFDERARRRAATRRTGSAGCAPPAGASATSPRRASTTAAPGRDARAARALAAARYHRGRAARRYDVFKGTAPALRAPSCARSPAASWHIVRGAAAASGIALDAR